VFIPHDTWLQRSSLRPRDAPEPLERVGLCRCKGAGPPSDSGPNVGPALVVVLGSVAQPQMKLHANAFRCSLP